MYFVLNCNVLALLSFYTMPSGGNRKMRWPNLRCRWSGHHLLDHSWSTAWRPPTRSLFTGGNQSQGKARQGLNKTSQWLLLTKELLSIIFLFLWVETVILLFRIFAEAYTERSATRKWIKANFSDSLGRSNCSVLEVDSLTACSVTRLGRVFKVLATNFLRKVPKYIHRLFGLMTLFN